MGYSSLISYIQSRVYENDSQDISGTGLQEALLQMVASLGDGYQFKGVATPTTNPGTPDQNVFYIASEVGTYSNFGLSVEENEVAVFLWNGSWSKQSTGAASAEVVSQLGQEIGNYDGKINLPFTIFADNRYVKYDDGTIQVSSVSSVIRNVDVSAYAGKTLYYKRFRNPNASGSQGMAFYDADGNYISGVSPILNAPELTMALDSVVIPLNAKYASFSCVTTMTSAFEVYALSDIATDLLKKMPLIPIDNAPTEGSDNLVKSGGVYEAITPVFTNRTSLNVIFDELYVLGRPAGSYFSFFTWDGSVVTAILRDAEDNIIWFANGRTATAGEVFEYSQNGVTIYAIFNTNTYGISPQTTQIGGKALSLEYNPRISAYIFAPIQKDFPLNVSRFNLNELLPGGTYNASWISIARRCDEVNDSVFCFANKTAQAVSNKFFDFYLVGTHARGKDFVTDLASYIDQSTINTLPTSDTLLLSLVVAAVNNADGDNLTQKWRTGGAHAYGNQTTGSPTMRELSNDVRVDGKLIPIGTANVRGRNCTINVDNNIQGYNTCKENGGGREIIQQRAHILITNDFIEATIEYVALEEVIVYGPLLATGMSVVNMDGYRFIGSMSKPGLYVFDGTGNMPSADDNRNNAIRIENGGYLFDTELDLSYGLGNKKENNTPNLFVTTAGKAYFEILPDTDQIHLDANDSLTYKTRMYLRKK